MHLIFIRHGDPDYKHNTVTEKGAREAALLAQRIAKWKVTDFYCSPYGRAADTLAPALKIMNRSAATLDWLKEFDWRVKSPFTKKERGAWDWLPRELYAQPKLFDKDKWTSSASMKSGRIDSHYEDVCKGIDTLLEGYDYTHIPGTSIYNCLPHLSEEEAAVDTHLNPVQKDLDDRTLVFVCHLGSMFTVISHLTGLSPVMLWQGFFVAPTSVTVLSTEERVPGEAVFRVQQMGDISHLTAAGEGPSASGFYGNFTVF